MNRFRERGSAGRWAVSASAALLGMLLFMLLTLGIRHNRLLTDCGPLLELQYVTVTDPGKQREKTPQVKPRKQQETPPEALPQPSADNAPSETPHLDPTPAAPAAVDVPAAPGTPPAPASDQPRRLGSPAELDNIGFEPVVNPKPDYPVVAQESRITGYVDVDLLIGEDGRIRSFSLVTVKGHPAFGIETAKVLPQWRFPPPRVSGKKCSVKYIYRINFVLN
jgi:TonB family protein